MNILDALKQLRDDIKTWVANNLNELNTRLTKAINNIPKFSGDYNDLTNAPNIAEDESGNMVIADESGNIIFKADADGIHTTAVSLNGEAAATEKYVDDAIANINISEPDFTGYATETYVDTKVADLVNSAPEALNTLGELATALENHEDAYDALLETVGGKSTHADLKNLKEELSESITAEAEDWKVVDGDGNIIFSVDNTGAHTTTLTLNGEEAATKTYVDEAIGDIKLPETDFTGYATEKYVDDAISTIPQTDLTGYATEEYVNEAIAGIDTGDIDLSAYALAADVAADKVIIDAHMGDEVIHVTDADREKWDAKSDFSGAYADLNGAPHIVNDNEDEVVICDSQGNVILRATAEGLNVTAIYINGKTVIPAYDDSMEGAVLKIVNGAPTWVSEA